MTDVHDLLRRALGGVAPSPDALQATIQRIHRRQRRRRVLVAGVTLAVFVGVGVVVTRGLATAASASVPRLPRP